MFLPYFLVISAESPSLTLVTFCLTGLPCSGHSGWQHPPFLLPAHEGWSTAMVPKACVSAGESAPWPESGPPALCGLALGSILHPSLFPPLSPFWPFCWSLCCMPCDRERLYNDSALLHTDCPRNLFSTTNSTVSPSPTPREDFLGNSLRQSAVQIHLPWSPSCGGNHISFLQ